MKVDTKVPEGWKVEYAPKPIPDHSHDWDFWHNSFDDGNPVCGTAKSRDDAIQQILDWEWD